MAGSLLSPAWGARGCGTGGWAMANFIVRVRLIDVNFFQ